MEAEAPTQEADWVPKRVIRAAALVEIATGLGGLTKPRTVRLRSGRIEGILDLEGRELACPLEFHECSFEDFIKAPMLTIPRLSFDTCSIPFIAATQLKVRSDLSITNSQLELLGLQGAHVGGQLDLSGTTLVGETPVPPKATVLFGEDLHVDQDVFLRQGFCATGRLAFAGAYVGGQLDIRGARLDNHGGATLSARNAEVAQDLFFNANSSSHGELDLDGIHVGGELSLSGAELINPDAFAITARAAQIDGDMICRHGFRAMGGVDLTHARIAGQLDLSASLMSSAYEDALSLGHAHITHVRLPSVSTPTGTLDLRHAHIETLEDSWGKVRYHARLAGLTYENLESESSDAATRKEWLAEATDGYLPHPYEQLASVFRRAGRDDDARSIAMAKQRERRKLMNRWGRAGSWLVDRTIGYGYQVWRAGLLLGALVLVNAFVFAWAKAHHHMIALRATHLLPHEEALPTFHSWLYSLDILLPVINLGQKDYWASSGVVQLWYAVSVLVGWILVTLIFAALTVRLVRE